MVDQEIRDLLGRGEADIDPHALAPVFVGSHRAPGYHAGAGGAEVKLEEWVRQFLASIDRRGAGETDALSFPVIGPEGAVAAADRAVARRDRARIAVELPFDRATVTGARSS